MSKSWLILGQSDSKDRKQQIIQIGQTMGLKVLKGVNDHILVDLTSRRFSFSEEIHICGSKLNLDGILTSKDKRIQKVYTSMTPKRDNHQVMAVLYLEISIEGIESELVSGESLLTGVANELHLLGRKNHPDLYKQLEAYNEAKRKDKDVHLNYTDISMKDHFQLTQMIDKTMPFLAAIDPVVTIVIAFIEIFTLKNPTNTLLFLTAATLGIVYFELAISSAPLALSLFILYNSYYMRRYKVSRPNIARNVSFLCAQMDLIIATRPQIESWLSDVVFWGKPQLAILFCKAALPLSLASLIGICFFPLRWAAVFCLWGPVLSQVEFIKVLMQAVTLQLSETDFQRLQNTYWNSAVSMLHKYQPSEKNQARISKIYRILVISVKFVLRCLKYLWTIAVHVWSLAEAALLASGLIKREALLEASVPTEALETSH